MFATILLVLLGVLGASKVIVARRPDAEAWIARLVPYQSWIGAASAVLGGLWLVSSPFHLRQGLAHFVVHTGSGAVALGLGLVLGIEVLKSFFKDARTLARLDGAAVRLTPYQSALGVLAMVFGALRVVL